MSTYYTFYLGMKNDENKLEIAGPYYYNIKKQEMRLGCLYEASRSFVEHDAFMKFMDKVPLEEMADKDKKYFTDTGLFGDKEYSRAYICSLEAMWEKAKEGCYGLQNGYCRLEDIDHIKREDYILTDSYEVGMYSADRVAEMDADDRKDLGRAAFLAACDPAHQAYKISCAAESCLNYVYGEERNRYCIVLVWG